MSTTTACIKPPFVLLFLLVCFGSVGAVLFTPALPLIQSYFDITVAEAQLTITIYLLGYAFGQLPYGPLANGIGRKKALFIGLSIAMVGSLLCAFSYHAHSFGLLLVGRLIQALGACVGLKISFTMIADLYEQTAATKKISQLLIAFAVLPGIAVAIGGWLTHFWGWQSCFYFLAIFSVIMLLFSCILKETAKTLDTSYLHPLRIIQEYKATCKNKKLVLSAVLMGCGSAIVYLFASKAPFIGIVTLGMFPQDFGNLNLIPAVGMIAGSLLAMYLAGKFSFSKLVGVGIAGSMAAALLMLTTFVLGMLNWVTLFVPITFLYVAEALIFSNASGFGLSSAKDKSNGSAMLNFINLSLALCGVFFAQWIYPESAIILPLAFVFLLLIMTMTWLKLKKIK